MKSGCKDNNPRVDLQSTKERMTAITAVPSTWLNSNWMLLFSKNKTKVFWNFPTWQFAPLLSQGFILNTVEFRFAVKLVQPTYLLGVHLTRNLLTTLHDNTSHFLMKEISQILYKRPQRPMYCFKLFATFSNAMYAWLCKPVKTDIPISLWY